MKTKKKYHFLLLIFFTFIFIISKAQYATDNGFTKFKNKLINTHWSIGISGNVIDDDGDPLGNLFNVGNSWNVAPYPSIFTLNGWYNKKWSIEFSFLFNKMSKDKIINSSNNLLDYYFFAFDFNANYHLNASLGASKLMDPFIIIGYGISNRTNLEKNLCATNNVGLGLAIWPYNGLGIKIQSLAKFGITGPGNTNYLQHSIGLIYKLNFVQDRFNLRHKVYSVIESL